MQTSTTWDDGKSSPPLLTAVSEVPAGVFNFQSSIFNFQFSIFNFQSPPPFTIVTNHIIFVSITYFYKKKQEKLVNFIFYPYFCKIILNLNVTYS